ncbi:MAG: site-specific integrase [Actinomycetia bacterium]|nr:site-specific integrase [Actinomycetes bacterium]
MIGLFASNFAGQMEDMIELKESLGRTTGTLAFYLRSFGSYCLRAFPKEAQLTYELASGWCEEGASNAGSGYKMRAIREFGKYLVSVGIDAFVFPSEWIGSRRAKPPYIFRDDELAAFFAATDEVAPSKNSPLREYSIPVFFRLQYYPGGGAMKRAADSFLRRLREYFTVFLPRQRNSSPHTVTACRQTWNMFLGYIEDRMGIALANMTFAAVDRGCVTGFLEYMSGARGWCSATYNQRLCCIRPFFKYAAGIEPLLAIYRDDLAGIPLKKGTANRTVKFMGAEAVRALLAQPDPETRTGMRDRFFMALMYDTAARDCEMLSLALGGFDAQSLTVTLMGKGSKLRIVPVSAETVALFEQYIGLFHQGGDNASPLFYTVHRGTRTQMPDDNAARFMSAYGKAARESCADIPPKVHPHLLRHSRAMSLYRAGMPLALLSEWLGHEDPEATLIYAYADTEMKRAAIEKATAGESVSGAERERGVWEGNDDMIKKLCGLG